MCGWTNALGDATHWTCQTLCIMRATKRAEWTRRRIVAARRPSKLRRSRGNVVVGLAPSATLFTNTLWKPAHSPFMFPPFSILLVFLAAFDVVCAGHLHDSAARLRQLAPSLHGIIKRQADQNTTTTNTTFTNSTSNVNATLTSAVTVPLTLASDKA